MTVEQELQELKDELAAVSKRYTDFVNSYNDNMKDVKAFIKGTFNVLVILIEYLLTKIWTEEAWDRWQKNKDDILGPVSNADGRYDDNFVDNFTKKFKAHLAGE